RARLPHWRLDAMKRPVAHPVTPEREAAEAARAPRAFEPNAVTVTEGDFESVPPADDLVSPEPPRIGWIGRVLWTTAGILLSAALALGAERLSRDLFARYEWLGWVGLGVFSAFIVALLSLIVRE